MKNLTKLMIALAVIVLASCSKKEDCTPVEKIVTVHDTIINGETIYIRDTVTINSEPTYSTTGTWKYFNYESSINNGSWDTYTKNEKWKFTAYRVFVDANNDGLYEKEGFFGNFGTYITIYFYDETTARKYDVILSNSQDLWIGRTVGNLREKLYMQKI